MNQSSSLGSKLQFLPKKDQQLLNVKINHTKRQKLYHRLPNSCNAGWLYSHLIQELAAAAPVRTSSEPCRSQRGRAPLRSPGTGSARYSHWRWWSPATSPPASSPSQMMSGLPFEIRKNGSWIESIKKVGFFFYQIESNLGENARSLGIKDEAAIVPAQHARREADDDDVGGRDAPVLQQWEGGGESRRVIENHSQRSPLGFRVAEEGERHFLIYGEIWE